MTKRDTQAAEYASESQSAGLEQREPPASIPGPGGEGSIPSTADAMATRLRLTDEEREAIERSIRFWRGGFRPHPFATVLSQLLRRLQLK